MSDTQVSVQIEGVHASITLTTESGVNVLAPAVLNSINDALVAIKSDGSVRTLSIQAEGKVFAAGADIKLMAGFGTEDARNYAKEGQSVLDEIASLPIITVAAINGAALGGGLELALSCDFRIAVKSAKLGLPEASLGLIPGWRGIDRLTKLVGSSRAKRLYFSALPVSAEDGLTFGLVDEIVNSPEDLVLRVGAFCKSFRRGSPSAVALAKRADRDDDDITAFSDCFDLPDSQEGMAAFIEKRPASWME